jgi:hypothetical protein
MWVPRTSGSGSDVSYVAQHFTAGGVLKTQKPAKKPRDTPISAQKLQSYADQMPQESAAKALRDANEQSAIQIASILGTQLGAPNFAIIGWWSVIKASYVDSGPTVTMETCRMALENYIKPTTPYAAWLEFQIALEQKFSSTVESVRSASNIRSIVASEIFGDGVAARDPTAMAKPITPQGGVKKDLIHCRTMRAGLGIADPSWHEWRDYGAVVADVVHHLGMSYPMEESLNFVGVFEELDVVRVKQSALDTLSRLKRASEEVMQPRKSDSPPPQIPFLQTFPDQNCNATDDMVQPEVAAVTSDQSTPSQNFNATDASLLVQGAAVTRAQQEQEEIDWAEGGGYELYS